MSDLSDPHPPPTDDERLLAFLRDRDVTCPLCRYNLRDLTTPVCPECRQRLELSVGVRDVTLGWFIVTLTPHMFSGICAMLLLIPIIIVPMTGGGTPPLRIFLLDAFGWASGCAGVFHLVRRMAFLRQAPSRQRAIAIGTWVVHVVMAIVFFAWALM